jgi:hypothetical protein
MLSVDKFVVINLTSYVSISSVYYNKVLDIIRDKEQIYIYLFDFEKLRDIGRLFKYKDIY